MIPEKLRRPIAIVALVGGVGAALLTMQRDVEQAKVVLLLTHVEHDVGGAKLTRDRLVGVIVESNGEHGPWRGKRTFQRGRAPEATAPFDIELGPGVERIGVRCLFDAGGSEPIVGSSAVVVERRPSLQVVDVGSCNGSAAESVF